MRLTMATEPQTMHRNVLTISVICLYKWVMKSLKIEVKNWNYLYFLFGIIFHSIRFFCAQTQYFIWDNHVSDTAYLETTNCLIIWTELWSEGKTVYKDRTPWIFHEKKPTCVRVSILDARNICFFFRKNDSHFTSISIHINNLRQLRVFTPLASYSSSMEDR